MEENKNGIKLSEGQSFVNPSNQNNKWSNVILASIILVLAIVCSITLIVEIKHTEPSGLNPVFHITATSDSGYTIKGGDVFEFVLDPNVELKAAPTVLINNNQLQVQEDNGRYLVSYVLAANESDLDITIYDYESTYGIKGEKITRNIRNIETTYSKNAGTYVADVTKEQDEEERKIVASTVNNTNIVGNETTINNGSNSQQNTNSTSSKPNTNTTVTPVPETNQTTTITTNTKVTGLELSRKIDTVYVGEIITLYAIIFPDNATNKKVSWTSSNNTVASVSASGKVTAKAVGSAIITCTTDDGKYTSKYQINVKEVEVEISSIKLSETKGELNVGDSITIKPTIEPSNASIKKVSWGTKNPNIAVVDNTGKVTGIKAGTTDITATAGGKTVTYTVTVKNVPATSIAISIDNSEIYIGKTAKITVKFTPENTTDKTITWSSNYPKIASVSNGVVTGLSNGNAKITAKTSNGKTASVSVTIKKIAVSSVTVNPTSKTINVGDTLQIQANILPDNASIKDVTWTSNNTTVATVDATGKVTAKKAGNAVITAKTKDGSKTASSTITVKNVANQSISLSTTSKEFNLNDTNADNLKTQLSVTFNPTNTTNKALTYTSSNTKVATVDTKGVVSAVGPGSATITVKSNESGKTATFTATVRKKVAIVVGTDISGMSENVTTFTNKDKYTKTAGSLQYIKTWNDAKTKIESYSASKAYTSFYVYFTLPIADAKKYTCSTNSTSDEYYISATTAKIKNLASTFNSNISGIKSAGYSVKAYVISTTAVNPNATSASSNKVVKNSNDKACVKEYYSNYKFNLYNQAVGNALSSYSSNLTYLNMFNNIVDVSSEEYSFKKINNVDYKTGTNGYSLTAATIKEYTNAVFKTGGM